MSRIFIGHSSANNVAALALSQWLDQEGWSDHFLDFDAQRGLSPGQRWQAALAAAVDRCEAVIFLISPAWRDSPWCLAEFHQAKSLGKPIFGVLVEATPRTTLRHEMTTEWQLCDLVDGEERVRFSVGKPPVVPPATIDFALDGLNRLRIGLNRAGLDPSTFNWPPPKEPDRSPYPGLRALDAQDAAVFFGRDASIVRAMDQLRLVRERGIERLFVILGASGAGKSSFLRAGLLPRVERDTEHFLVLPVIRPERSALHGTYGLVSCLEHAFAKAKTPITRAEVSDQLASAPALATLLRRLAGASGVASSATQLGDKIAERTIVLPIDQGEELFIADGGAESRALLDLIAALDGELRTSHPPPQGTVRLRLLVVLTIRSDSLRGIQADPVLCQLSPALFSLPPMPISEFKAVIEGPARRHSEAGHRLTIRPDLTELLIRDSQGADALPLLALTLEWLYREYGSVRNAVIGVDEYEKLGGVRGAINIAVRRALDRPQFPPVIPAASGEQQHLLRKCFPALATVDPDSGEPKRLVASQDELLSDSPDTLPFIDRLVEQHLLLRDRRQIAGHGEATVIEVAHEALLRHWDAMAQWLAEYSEALMALEALRRAAGEWHRNSRDPVLLVHSGHRLAAAETLRNHVLRDRLNEVDESYLDAARQMAVDQLKERERQLQEIATQQKEIATQQQARARLQRMGKWGLAVGTLALLAVAWWVVGQTRAVSRQTSLVLTDAGERADNDKRFDRGLRFGVLAARESSFQPAHPNASPQLARAAVGSWLRSELVHQGAAYSASFSADGKRVVTASADNTARIWDAETGKPVGEALKHEGPVFSASFSADGKRVVTASADNTARIWDAESGKPVGEALKHGQLVFSASFSADGKRVVTASDDKTARVWDAETGKPVGEALKHEDSVNSASFSADGKRVVTASDDKTARVWDAETGKPLGEELNHEKSVLSASFSADGKRVVTASRDRTARIWDAETGKPVGEALKHGQLVFVASFSADGKRVVTASLDDTARIWDAETGKPVGEALKHDDSVNSASFSADGKRVVTASADNTARIWDAETGKPLGEALKHEDSVNSASFSDDGKQVVTASDDNTARIWDAETGKPLGEALKHEDSVLSASFSADVKRVVTASFDKTARIWDAETGKPLGEALKHEGLVNSASFSVDSKRVVTASADKTARIWDAETGKPLGEALKHEGLVNSASFSADGKRVVTASRDNTARIWDAETGKPVGEALKHRYWVLSASFSADGKRVVTASADNTARIWDAESGKPVGEALMHGQSVLSASFSADGKRVVTASDDKTARVWDAETGKPVGEALKHGESVLSAGFSADGKRVVTASHDKTARIWDVETGKSVGEALKHEGPVNSASFSADGKRVVTASDDNTARIWDAETGKPVGEALKHENWVHSASFSADGKRVVSASADKTARIWDVSWSALARSPALLQQVCMTKLVGSARRLTAQDIAASPILAGREGEDICAGINAD